LFESVKKAAVNGQDAVRNFVQPFVDRETVSGSFLPALVTKLFVELIRAI
jgi:hypothetical protein